MKRTIAKKANIDHKSDSSDVSMNCSCQILNDTSLSNVGDSQCDCSECLEANLNAFNQFKNEQIKTHDTTREGKTKKQGNMSKPHSNAKQQKQQSSSLHRYRSSDKFPADKKTSKKWGAKIENEEKDSDYFGKFEQENQYSNGQLNDFLLITRYRTRKYLEQRKKLEEEQKQKKQQLKQKIKKNLELLKYTSMYQNQRQQGEQELAHPYKWNHSKYKCQCNGKLHSHQKHKCCSRIKVKQTLDTNLQKLKENFMQNRDHILQERKKKRQQKIKNKQEQSCPDQCPDHHNRTDPNKIQKIKKFVNKNVKMYYKNLDKKKKQKEDRQKIKQGKLRAIDIKSKQILGRSKKVDDDISRTSFRLSIQQYDTFSELRQQNQRRKKMKENDREVKKAIKEGGGQLEKKIYEQLQEDQVYEPSEIKIKTKAEAPEHRNHDQIYQRIAYDAQIKPPSNYKSKPQARKQSKNEYGREEKKEEKKKNLSKGKEQEQKKRIENEIEKKKKQIMQQFKKRNTNKPSNHELRKQYQEKIDKNKQTKKMKAERDEPQKDPFRTNYPTKAGKNDNQIQVHGDPLLQQYTYHKQKDKGKIKGPRGQNMNIFNQNIHSLTSKTSLKP